MPAHHIDQYQFGKIIVDGISHSKDLIILPSRIISSWWRKEGHILNLEDLDEVLPTNPQLLVIGMGVYSRMRVSTEVEHALQAAGIAWIALPTGEACQEYNHQSLEQEVAAALHLTC